MQMRIGAPSTAIALAVAAAAFAGCGGGPSDDAGPQARTAAAAPTRTAEEGELMGSDGKVVREFGDPADNRRAVDMLERLQRDFRAGRMAAACGHIQDFMLSQFEPGGSESDSPCADKLGEYARVTRLRDRPPKPIELLWVRSYGWEAGVWVEDESGARIRVPFHDRDGEGWKLELGSFGNPEVLGGRLVTR
ncbi:MAG: hypothetical protein GXY03_13940 [Solirubrobacterales bacterium]|nr:hypothetical protein [Solirubrobacterales bacterium]